MKRIDKNINSILYNYACKIFRTKKEIIILLMETLKIFYLEGTSISSQGKICIIIDKMSRIFYCFDDKIFSVVFPFGIEKQQDNYRIYDIALDIDIDSKLISIMLGALRKYDFDNASIEKIYDEYCEDIADCEDIRAVETAWKILIRLFSMELGYIRYDDDPDPKREDAVYHPRYHFDINYTQDATYKIGLGKKIAVDEMISIMDSKSRCSYLR